MSPAAAVAAAPAGVLADLAARFWDFRKAEQPFGALLAGQLGDEAVLFREAPADYDRRADAAAAFLVELDAIDAEALSAADRIDRSLLRRELEGVRDFHAVAAHLRPALLPVGPDFNTVVYANTVSITDAASARLHVARLAELPGYLTDVRACLKAGHAQGLRYPRLVLHASAAGTRGNAAATPEASPWYAPFRRSAVKDRPEVAQEAARALALVRDAILPALHAHADFLEGALCEGARDTLSCIDAPDGERFYALLARHFTSTDLAPAEIHALGLAEVARIEGEMEGVAADAGFAGDLAGYRAFLLGDPQFIAPDAETLRERIEILCKRIDARIPAFFRRIPRITYGVAVVPPEASATLPAAYALPASPGGTTAGMFYVNGLPERCPSYIHPAMVVHEAWPGHLMHIGMMAELDHQPAFRRYNASAYSACVEGWALYCEQLGIELGVYTTPNHHYGRLDLEMWRACRLVVDTGLHLHGWTRERAVAFMVERLTLSPDAIGAEVDRYAGLPAQALAYQIGGLKFRELRTRAQAALGEAFDLRAYHEAVMTAGAITLPLLEQVVDTWIAAEQAAATGVRAAA